MVRPITTWLSIRPVMLLKWNFLQFSNSQLNFQHNKPVHGSYFTTIREWHSQHGNQSLTQHQLIIWIIVTINYELVRLPDVNVHFSNPSNRNLSCCIYISYILQNLQHSFYKKKITQINSRAQLCNKVQFFKSPANYRFFCRWLPKQISTPTFPPSVDFTAWIRSIMDLYRGNMFPLIKTMTINITINTGHKSPQSHHSATDY